MNVNNWKPFRYDEIFTIKKGKRLTKADMIEGDINYIGAVDSNNGITAKIANDEFIHSANTITVSYNGSIAEAFFQIKPFWATDDVNVLYPKFSLTQNIAMFLCAIIRKEKYRFSYGRKWDKETMEKSIIKLPATSEVLPKPDWQWIENYVKNTLIPKLPRKAKSVWNKNFVKTSLTKQKNLNLSEWREFNVGVLLECNTTTNLIETELGNINYVSRSALNNGVSKLVSGEGYELNVSNCITIGAEGMYAFYQNKPFVSGVKIYTLRHEKINQYNAMFLCTVLNKEIYRYNYGRARILDNIKAENIKLPAIPDGIDKHGNPKYKPNWKFMEDYIKSLPYGSLI